MIFKHNSAWTRCVALPGAAVTGALWELKFFKHRVSFTYLVIFQRILIHVAFYMTLKDENGLDILNVNQN